jgi:serine/threonine-protein kinase
MAVTASQWKRLSPLLDAALDLPPGERAAWLAELPVEHADLRESLGELLAGGRAIETGDFLDRLPEFSAVPSALSLDAGNIVGPYRLLRELGCGGTSSVWLAERVDGTIQRKVALKLPHLGLVDRGIADRIAREVDILATLEHPNIARLYDAGVDERGRPYLALEYVQGVPPDEYCRVERLELRRKLALFLKILRAVSFAHARLIVHRDLKPSNILISSECEAHLLDFGIAQLLQPDATLRAAHTVIGAAALTPAYAAPEQFTGQPITVATDVYSLGVILFEMLTGVGPYTPKGRSVGAYEHAVLEVEPPLMSQVARPADVSALRGDLDAIVAKALEKAPADRYASAEAFANDIERHLVAEPIAARPRSFAYVAKKFLRRNALPVALAVSVIVVLSIALGFAGWQWRDAERQRVIASERLANSLAAEQFTSTVLIEGMQPGESISFEELIARSEQIARDTGESDVRTRVFATDFLATWYAANGLYVRGEEVLSRTLESLPPEKSALGAPLRCRRAYLWGQLGRSAQAIAVLDHEIAANDADDAIASNCLLDRARLAANAADARAALDYATQSLARYERAGVESVYGRTAITQIIAAAHGLNDEFAEAHAGYREALRLFDVAGRSRSRAAASVHDDWASAWMNSGNPQRALEELDLGWEILHALAPNSQRSDGNLLRRGRILSQLGRDAEARANFDAARLLAAERGTVVSLAAAMIGQADIAIADGDLAAAERYLDEAGGRLTQADLPPQHLISIRFATTRATLLAARHQSDAARRLFGTSIETYEAQGCCRSTIAWLLAQRGELAVREGDLAAAEDDTARARSLAPPLEAESFSRYTARAWYATGLLRERERQARAARDAYATAAMQFAGALGDAHPDTVRAREAIQRVAAMIPTENRT